MFETTGQAGMRSLFSDAVISARVARSNHVRVEFLRCPTDATVRWNVGSPNIALMWVRDKGSMAQFTLAGARPEPVAAGRAHFWFFPQGSYARGEITGEGDYDCAGVFVDPAVLPPDVKHALAEPKAGPPQGALGRAFDGLVAELTEPNEFLPLFTEGWAMQALAHVARSTSVTTPGRVAHGSGLAPWQLRRARDMLRAHIDGDLEIEEVANSCRLSSSHFSRAFKISTGVPPYQWLMLERVTMAQDLLANTSTPLVHVAGQCGFADQSHLCRVFARVKGCSPGAWRREHRAP